MNIRVQTCIALMLLVPLIFPITAIEDVIVIESLLVLSVYWVRAVASFAGLFIFIFV